MWLLLLEIVSLEIKRNTIAMKLWGGGGKKKQTKKIVNIQIIHKIIIIVIILSCDRSDVLNSCQKTITFHRWESFTNSIINLYWRLVLSSSLHELKLKINMYLRFVIDVLKWTCYLISRISQIEIFIHYIKLLCKLN